MNIIRDVPKLGSNFYFAKLYFVSKFNLDSLQKECISFVSINDKGA